jgi:hypothetical protein
MSEMSPNRTLAGTIDAKPNGPLRRDIASYSGISVNCPGGFATSGCPTDREWNQLPYISPSSGSKEQLRLLVRNQSLASMSTRRQA